jgi:hypothetical protein
MRAKASAAAFTLKTNIQSCRHVALWRRQADARMTTEDPDQHSDEYWRKHSSFDRHASTIRALEVSVGEIKTTINDGLKVMVSENRVELHTVKTEIQLIRDSLNSHLAKEDVIYEIFKRVMNVGIVITGGLVTVLLSIIGYLLVAKGFV